MPTILVADDSATIRNVVKMALKGSSYDVVEAENGDQTRKMAEEGPDLVLLDYHLPDISGVELCRELKSQTSTRDIPILMLEGNFHDTDAEGALKIGAKSIIHKPFKTEELLGPIRKTVSPEPSNKEEKIQDVEDIKESSKTVEKSAEWADRIREKAKEKAKELSGDKAAQVDEPEPADSPPTSEKNNVTEEDVEPTQQVDTEEVGKQVEASEPDEQTSVEAASESEADGGTAGADESADEPDQSAAETPEIAEQDTEPAQSNQRSAVDEDEIEQIVESKFGEYLSRELSDHLESELGPAIRDYFKDEGEQVISEKVETLVDEEIMPLVQSKVQRTINETVQKKFDALSDQLDKKVQQFVHSEIKSLLSE
jgi:CheY-like chemotaxis protein